MTRHLITPLLVTALAVVAFASSAASPDAKTIVELAVAAADPDNTLPSHDMIVANVREQETTSDATTEVKDLRIVLYGDRLQEARLELSPDITVVLHEGQGWATIHGQLDTRHTAAKMAAGTVRQKVFPLLFPFSLELEGVMLNDVAETTFDGRKAWVVNADFAPAFFTAPSMVTTWKIFFDRENHMVLGAEFFPAEEFRGPSAEGVRYRVLTWKNLDGISLPGEMLLEGIDVNGTETGHVRVTKIEYSDGGPFDPSLFVHPEVLERLDAGDVE
jgi:hypothetical protein